MKLIILLLLSTIGYSQSQNLMSFEIIKDGEFIRDTSSITLTYNSLQASLIIRGKEWEYLKFQKEPSREYINIIGIKSVVYDIDDIMLPIRVEFLYKSKQLLQITIIRLFSTISYIIHPQKELI